MGLINAVTLLDSCAQTVPPNPPFSSLCTLVEIAGSTQELWDVFRPFFTLLWSQFKVHPPAKIKSYIRIELQTFALLLQNLLENRGHVSLSKHRLPLSYIHGHNVVGAWSLRARRREVSATESWSEALTSSFPFQKLENLIQNPTDICNNTNHKKSRLGTSPNSTVIHSIFFKIR